MRTHTERQGWYSDITLEGDFVSLHRDSHIVVNNVRIELPGENVLFLVCKRWKEQIILAGQGNNSGRTLLYRDSKWIDLGLSFGTFSCAFGPDALYFVCGPNLYRIYDLQTGIITNPYGKQLGSQGIRYIDFNQSIDGIVTGDSTYGPSPYNLSQWTLREDLVLGQSYEDGGVGLVLGEKYHKFCSGSTEFIRYYRKGNDLAFCIINQPDKFAAFWWMTLEEFKQFPIINDSVDPIPEPTKPVEPAKPKPTTPTPKEKNIMISKDDVRDGSNEIIAFYNEPEGLNRKARGRPSPIEVDDQAAFDWVALFLTFLAQGMSKTEAVNKVKNEIKKFPEYKEQHQGETPVNPK